MNALIVDQFNKLINLFAIEISENHNNPIILSSGSCITKNANLNTEQRRYILLIFYKIL
jgi:hypothetical protein